MNKTINITHFGNSIALQFFDYYYAYKQNQNQNSNYQSNITIEFNQPLSTDKINILLVDVDTCFKYRNSSDFNLILIDNFGEPLEVSSYMVLLMLEQHPSAYFLCGGHVEQQHRFANKILSYHHQFQTFVDYITRPFYPQYYEIKKDSKTRTNSIYFINGQTRTNRKFFLQCLNKVCGNEILVRDRIHTYQAHATKLLDCAFESQADQDFRIWLNENITNHDNSNEEKIKYYENSVRIGINNKFGTISPGNFILDEYFSYHCIVYPESSWINNQMMLTEKTGKCCVSKSIPWPIAGANFHNIMHDFGFMTAIDLLPSELQKFDAIEDHHVRYLAQCQAIKWAFDHPEIWLSHQADRIRQNNFENCFNNPLTAKGIKKFDSIIESLK